MNHNIEQELEKQGYYVSTTVGWSMWPMLRNRKDRIILLPKGEERLKRHDLPLYRRPDGKYILHRILRVKDGEYVIRGDNTYRLEQVPDSWVLGYVSEFYRGGRHISADSRLYRVYIVVWRLLFPLRFVAYHALRVLHGLWKRVRGKKKESN